MAGAADGKRRVSALELESFVAAIFAASMPVPAGCADTHPLARAIHGAADSANSSTKRNSRDWRCMWPPCAGIAGILTRCAQATPAQVVPAQNAV